MQEELESWEVAVRRALIDHSNLSCLWHYRRSLLTQRQSRLLKIVTYKIDRNPDWFGRKEQCYGQTAGLILMSSWHRAPDIITCMDEESRREFGFMNDDRPVLNCRYWQFCDHDAWRREMDLQCRFLRQFDEGKWVFITFSFLGSLPMQGGIRYLDGPPLTHADLTTYWSANRFALDQKIKDGLFRGAVLSDELHIESLFPAPMVTPHSHIVALVDKLPSTSDIEEIQTLIGQFCGKVWDFDAPVKEQWDHYYEKRDLFTAGVLKTKPRKPPLPMMIDPHRHVELPISINVKPLLTERAFSNALGYLVKPVQLAKAYRSTRAILVREYPDGLELLTQNVSDLIMGVDLLLRPRRCPVYYGTCDPRTRSRYIGAPGFMLKDEEYQMETKALLNELPAEDNDPDDGCGG